MRKEVKEEVAGDLIRVTSGEWRAEGGKVASGG